MRCVRVTLGFLRLAMLRLESVCCDTRGVSRRTHTEYYVCERYCLRSVMTRAAAGDECGGCLRFAAAGDLNSVNRVKETLQK